MSQKVTLQMVIAVEYERGGVPIEVLKEMLEDVANRGADEGLFTQNTSAEVNQWQTYFIDPEIEGD